MTAQNGGLYYLSHGSETHSKGSPKRKMRDRPMTTQNGGPYYLSRGAGASFQGEPKRESSSGANRINPSMMVAAND